MGRFVLGHFGPWAVLVVSQCTGWLIFTEMVFEMLSQVNFEVTKFNAVFAA